MADNTARGEFRSTANADGSLNVEIDIIAGSGTIQASQLAIEITTPCQDRVHPTLIAVDEWSVFRQLTECQLHSEAISATFLRPVRVALVCGGFDSGQAVEGFVEITHGEKERLAELTSELDASPVESVFAATHGAIDDIYREMHRLVEFEKQSWLLRGEENVVLDNSPELSKAEADEAALLAATVTKRKPLGTHRLPDNTRTHKHGTFDYRFEKRRVDVPVYAEFTAPRLSDIWNDIVQCTNFAATTAVITAVVLENPAAGYKIFFPAWRGCLYGKIGNRVNQITVKLGTDPYRYGSWTYH